MLVVVAVGCTPLEAEPQEAEEEPVEVETDRQVVM
jgi:hypothetical protein